MWQLLRELDRILRGEATRLPDLREGTIKIPLGGMCFMLVVLGAVYGICSSTYGLVNRRPVIYQQALATTVKLPALFYLTLLVTFPSLYVFNALVGSRLRVVAVLRLIIASLAVMMAVLASFGTIVAFFSFTTKSYPFIVLVNVVVCGVSGVLGLLFLLRTLHRITIATDLEDDPRANGEPDERSTSALDPTPGQVPGASVNLVFRIWVVVFGLVGAQMAWVLRPFIGNPDLPFEWFRQRESNFFQSVWTHLTNLLN